MIMYLTFPAVCVGYMQFPPPKERYHAQEKRKLPEHLYMHADKTKTLEKEVVEERCLDHRGGDLAEVSSKDCSRAGDRGGWLTARAGGAIWISGTGGA